MADVVTTLAPVHQQFPRVFGGMGPAAVLIKATFDGGNYIVGGIPLSAASFGLSEIFSAFVNVATPESATTNYLVTATKSGANLLVQFFDQADSDNGVPFIEAATDALTNTVLHLLVLGA